MNRFERRRFVASATSNIARMSVSMAVYAEMKEEEGMKENRVRIE